MKKTVLISVLGFCLPAAGSVIYNNLTPNNLMGMASRPGTPGGFEIESADDFVTSALTTVNAASFTGLIENGTAGTPSISQVVVEIYREFPLNSDPPSGNVNTRANSPSDVAFDSRDSAGGGLSFVASTLAPTFTVLNSVAPGGIHPKPSQTTGGNGAVMGTEVQFDITFLTPFSLPADHYFFVPQVLLTNGGTFYWLSASRPISGAATTNFSPDLQAWTRDAGLDPDWSRVGTDIVGQGMFNAAFSLDGTAAPEPGTWILLAAGLAVTTWKRRAYSRM